MRKIELRNVKTESGAEINYVELCNACLKAPAQGGFSTDEMRVRLSALKEFPIPPRGEDGRPEKPPVDSIEVSEETFQELYRCVKNNRWVSPDQAIIDFVDYIELVATDTETKQK